MLQARHHAGRGNVAFGSDDGYFLVHFRPQRFGQAFAQNNAKFVRFERVKRTGRHFVGIIDDFSLLVGQDAAQLCAADFSRVGQQALSGNERRAGQNFGFAGKFLLQCLPGGRHTVLVVDQIAHFGVRRDIEQLPADFFLETVHHGQHHNQCNHAQCDADNRHHGNKRHEAAAFFGAQIAQTNPSFE